MTRFGLPVFSAVAFDDLAEGPWLEIEIALDGKIHRAVSFLKLRTCDVGRALRLDDQMVLSLFRFHQALSGLEYLTGYKIGALVSFANYIIRPEPAQT